MTAPVPAHGDHTTATPVPPGHVSAEDYARYRAEQLAAGANPPPADYEDDAPNYGPGQSHAGEWLADAEAEVAAEPRPRDSAQAELEQAGGPQDSDEKAAREREARAQALGAVAVPLEGTEGRTDVVYVLPSEAWSSWAMGRLQIGDFESWAEKCLAPDYYEEVWIDLDPTLGQVNAMFKAYREVTGQDTGKSRLSAATLRRSGRR